MANIPQRIYHLPSPRLAALYLPIRSSFSRRSFHFSFYLSLSLSLGRAYGHCIFIEIQAGFISSYSHVSRYSPLLSYTQLINLYRVLGFAFGSSLARREEGLEIKPVFGISEAVCSVYRDTRSKWIVVFSRSLNGLNGHLKIVRLKARVIVEEKLIVEAFRFHGIATK